MSCQNSFDKYRNLCYIGYMDTTILKKAGLTESQAKGYLALVEHGSLSPTELAERTGESRTNGYAIADKLVAYGLATKDETTKRTSYTATHPSSLETLAEKRRKLLMRNEQEVKAGLSPIIEMFYKFRDEPGARTLQGVEGIKEVYEDTLREKDDIYLVRTTADVSDLGEIFLDNYRENRAKAGINTYAITPNTKTARTHVITGEDTKLLFHRTFIQDNAYTAPAEINIYGDKVAFISFGEIQMATIIQSPTIAEAMRQLIKLLSAGLQEYSDTVKREIRSAEWQS